MMKKISVILLVILFSISLTGCQLVVTEDTETTQSNTAINTEVPIEDLGYVPIRFDYSILKDEMIDVSEYIFYTWLFSDSLNAEYLVVGADVGTSMEAITCHSKTHVTEKEDGTRTEATTEILEANIYIGRNLEGTPLYPTVTYMNENDEMISQQGYGFAMQRGTSTTYNYETELPNGDTYNIDLTLNIIIIDQLQTIEIREFDEDDNLIKTTLITEETILEELTLDENTDFIFIVETYEDQSGNLYTERLYFYDEGSVYYIYKYLNDDGFLYLDYLKIHFPE